MKPTVGDTVIVKRAFEVEENGNLRRLEVDQVYRVCGVNFNRTQRFQIENLNGSHKDKSRIMLKPEHEANLHFESDKK